MPIVSQRVDSSTTILRWPSAAALNRPTKSPALEAILKRVEANETGLEARAYIKATTKVGVDVDSAEITNLMAELNDRGSVGRVPGDAVGHGEPMTRKALRLKATWIQKSVLNGWEIRVLEARPDASGPDIEWFEVDHHFDLMWDAIELARAVETETRERKRWGAKTQAKVKAADRWRRSTNQRRRRQHGPLAPYYTEASS